MLTDRTRCVVASWVPTVRVLNLLLQLERRETLLPPYSPRRSLRIPFISRQSPERQFSRTPSTSNFFSPPPPHPRRQRSGSDTRFASGSPRPTFSSFDGAPSTSTGSSQTLFVPPQPPYGTGLLTPPSSTFSSSSLTLPKSHSNPSTPVPFVVSSGFPRPTLPPFPTRPPRHLRAANSVWIQRGAGAITGSFLIDPIFVVPSFLLTGTGVDKEKRPNILLETDLGDICVDIWIREGSYAHGAEQNWLRRQRHWGASESDADQEHEEYWRSDWTSTVAHPWPQKTREVVDVEVRSGSGNVSARIVSRSSFLSREDKRSLMMDVTCSTPNLTSVYVSS